MLDRKEEVGQLLPTEESKVLSLKEKFVRKMREEEIEWKQRSRCKWLNDGDNNTKFFHGMASARQKTNRINYLWDGEARLEKREDIGHHIEDFFTTLYSKEEWERPLLNNLVFNSIGGDNAHWLLRPFEEEEVSHAVFDFAGDKSPGPDGFPMAFFQRFWSDVKEDILQFMKEFHARGRPSKNLGASFIVLIPKKDEADRIRDFRPISLIGSVYKILTKVLAGRLQKVLPNIISPPQGAFV